MPRQTITVPVEFPVSNLKKVAREGGITTDTNFDNLIHSPQFAKRLAVMLLVCWDEVDHLYHDPAEAAQTIFSEHVKKFGLTVKEK